jgi:hypothetical protein
MAVQQHEVQRVASLYGMDWNKVWNVIQKLEPAIQDFVMVLLEQRNNYPQVVQGLPPVDLRVEALNPVASNFSVSPSDLQTLLQALGPLANLLFELLKKKSKPNATV